MAFYKKILVLKQVAVGFSTDGKNVSGIARVEADGREATLYLTLLNLASAAEGDYGAYLVNREGAVFPFSTGKNPVSFSERITPYPDLSGGFACEIAHRRNGALTPVAYHATAEFPLPFDRVKKRIEESEQRPAPAENTPEPPQEQVPDPPREAYEDEVVATENYYRKEDVDPLRLTLIEDEQNLHSETVGETAPRADPPEREEADAQPDPDETDAFRRAQTKTPGHGYYQTVRNELEGLFSKYPAEELLERSVEGSRFVKVNYAEGKYYTVGLIRLDGLPRYICYGVPGKYSLHPPKELAGYCSFLPLSLFDLKGDGYWMLYQDADTGDAVKMNYVE